MDYLEFTIEEVKEIDYKIYPYAKGGFTFEQIKELFGGEKADAIMEMLLDSGLFRDTGHNLIAINYNKIIFLNRGDLYRWFKGKKEEKERIDTDASLREVMKKEAEEKKESERKEKEVEREEKNRSTNIAILASAATVISAIIAIIALIKSCC